ncbi:cyclase family protein [Salipaludibacillus aurantiacus]|uniref:Kynurenine formamidase n=1 Tax=Salipaludibacillus aurantiacus TaxID=1601833 RepID=A0A1H9P3R8_9BACI|nr:cyclase family protein [Salipaludibacillus aurantiacus]SER42822.1 arylformamidase [Salipaludibacillus aurantiacus]
MSYIDITRSLSSDMAVWPGDQPFEYDPTMAILQGDSVNVGRVVMSTHTGTHIDAPYHYDEKGMRVDEIPLESVSGECIVVEAVNLLVIEESFLQNIDFKGTRKVLFKTTSSERGHSYDSFPVFTEEAALLLGEKGVELAGIDAPSVDPLESKTLPAHHAFKEAGTFILEGLDLHHVQPGIYELTAFPLKLKGGDGSPVRAVLKEIKRS